MSCKLSSRVDSKPTPLRQAFLQPIWASVSSQLAAVHHTESPLADMLAAWYQNAGQGRARRDTAMKPSRKVVTLLACCQVLTKRPGTFRKGTAGIEF